MTKKRTTRKPTARELRKRINKALKLAKKSQFYMEYPDDNHTMHFLNEMVRALAPEEYERIAAHPFWDFGEEPDSL